MHDVLATKSFLSRRICSTQLTPQCLWCTKLTKSWEHLFFECVIAKKVWEMVKIWWKQTHECTTALSFSKFYDSFYRGTTCQQAWRFVMTVALWLIWLARSGKIFQGKDVKVDSLKHIKKFRFFTWVVSNNWVTDSSFQQ